MQGAFVLELKQFFLQKKKKKIYRYVDAAIVANLMGEGKDHD